MLWNTFRDVTNVLTDVSFSLSAFGDFSHFLCKFLNQEWRGPLDSTKGLNTNCSVSLFVKAMRENFKMLQIESYYLEVSNAIEFTISGLAASENGVLSL